MAIKVLRLHHANVRLPDATEDQTRDFYGRILGLTPDPNFHVPNVFHWQAGEGTEVHMKWGETPTRLKNGEVLPHHFALLVEDLGEAKRWLAEQKVQYWEADVADASHEIFITDPAGNVVELYEAH